MLRISRRKSKYQNGSFSIEPSRRITNQTIKARGTTAIVTVVLSKSKKQASDAASIARQLSLHASVLTQPRIQCRRRTAGSAGFEHVVLLAFLLQVLLGVVGLLVVAFALEGRVSSRSSGLEMWEDTYPLVFVRVIYECLDAATFDDVHGDVLVKLWKACQPHVIDHVEGLCWRDSQSGA